MNKKLSLKWQKSTGKYMGFVARWKDICLMCVYLNKRWVGHVSLGIFQTDGPNRKTPKAAMRDAETLAIQLLENVIDYTDYLKAEYNYGE